MKGFRNSDVVARLGGDEFAVIIAGRKAFADRALARMREQAKSATSAFSEHLDWSVGQVRFDPNIHSDVDDLLQDADGRMYADKARRKRKLG